MKTLAKTKRKRYAWPAEAERILRKAKKSADPQKNVLLLHEQLQGVTKYSSRVVWSFLERNGFHRPAAGTYKRWGEKSLDFVLDNGYDKAAERYTCGKKRLYALVEREGRQVGATSTDYTVRSLNKLMRVREEVIERWIANGQLGATSVVYGGKPSWRISTDQLRSFVSSYGPSLIGTARRIPEKRLGFLEEVLYDGKHMDLDLLHTRESKKENDAFENGEYRVVA